MNTKKFLFPILVLITIILSGIIYIQSAMANSSNKTEEDYFGEMVMSAEFLEEELMKITIIAEDMKFPVLGIAFHLKYEKDKLMFLKYLPGEFLEKGGNPFYMVKDLRDQSKIIFGETLKHNDKFPVGSGEVTEIYFQILSGNEWELQFDRGVVSGANTVRQDIDKILWKDLWVSKNGSETVLSDLNYKNFFRADSIRVGENSVFSWVYILIASLLLVAVVTAIHFTGKKTWAQ
jgi:hypothetical protein